MIRKIIALSLLCLILAGCSTPATNTTTVTTTADTTTAPTTIPTTPPTTLPPAPQTVMGGYFTALEVNFGGYYVTSVTVTYDEDSLTQVYTVDDTTYQTTYDYHGRLLRQRMDSDSYWSEEIFTYNPLSDKPETEVFTRKNYSRTITRTFDDKGNTLSTETTNTDGEWNTYTYTYDEENRQLTEAYLSSGGSNTLLTYTYDENGNIVTEVSLSKGIKNREVNRTYDEKGNLTRESIFRFNSDGTTNDSSITDFTYDEKGNQLSQYQADHNGFWQKTESTYTADGKLLTEQTEDSEGYTTSVQNMYDENGNLYAGVESYGDSTYTYAYAYDENGQMTLKSIMGPEGGVEATTWKYSAAGKLLTMTTVYPDGTTEKEIRTYDQHNRMLTYASYYDGDLSSSCAYTYGDIELSLAEVENLKNLMQTVFVEFLP